MTSLVARGETFTGGTSPPVHADEWRIELAFDTAQAKWSDAQIARQDEVDNKIFARVCDLVGQPLDWNMECIAPIREAVQGVVCEKLKRMSPMEFYPYLAEESVQGEFDVPAGCDDGNGQSEPFQCNPSAPQARSLRPAVTAEV